MIIIIITNKNLNMNTKKKCNLVKIILRIKIMIKKMIEIINKILNNKIIRINLNGVKFFQNLKRSRKLINRVANLVVEKIVLAKMRIIFKTFKLMILLIILKVKNSNIISILKIKLKTLIRNL